MRRCPFSSRRLPGSLRFLFVVFRTSSRRRRRLLLCFLRTWLFRRSLLCFRYRCSYCTARLILILSFLELKTILLNAQVFSIIERHVRIRAASSIPLFLGVQFSVSSCGWLKLSDLDYVGLELFAPANNVLLLRCWSLTGFYFPLRLHCVSVWVVQCTRISV